MIDKKKEKIHPQYHRHFDMGFECSKTGKLPIDVISGFSALESDAFMAGLESGIRFKKQEEKRAEQEEIKKRAKTPAAMTGPRSAAEAHNGK